MEALSVFQWAILGLAALCIGMSKTGVQGLMLLVVPYMAMAFGAKARGILKPNVTALCLIKIICLRIRAVWNSLKWTIMTLTYLGNLGLSGSLYLWSLKKTAANFILI